MVAVSDYCKKVASQFIWIYAIRTATSVVLMLAWLFLIVFVGLKSANKFFKEILNSILHAPISFDTTLSGRVLSKVHLSGASCHYFSMPTSL